MGGLRPLGLNGGPFLAPCSVWALGVFFGRQNHMYTQAIFMRKKAIPQCPLRQSIKSILKRSFEMGIFYRDRAFYSSTFMCIKLLCPRKIMFAHKLFCIIFFTLKKHTQIILRLSIFLTLKMRHAI